MRITNRTTKRIEILRFNMAAVEEMIREYLADHADLEGLSLMDAHACFEQDFLPVTFGEEVSDGGE